MVNRKRWLSLTPEPEQELPRAVATLRHHRPPAGAVAGERARIERLILRGSEAGWLAYLHEVMALIDREEGARDPAVVRARRRAIAVISNHHNLLLGVSPRGARRTAYERERLSALLAGGPNPDQEYVHEPYQFAG
jgi:hypothetical protein